MSNYPHGTTGAETAIAGNAEWESWIETVGPGSTVRIDGLDGSGRVKWIGSESAMVAVNGADIFVDVDRLQPAGEPVIRAKFYGVSDDHIVCDASVGSQSAIREQLDTIGKAHVRIGDAGAVTFITFDYGAGDATWRATIDVRDGWPMYPCRVSMSDPSGRDAHGTGDGYSVLVECDVPVGADISWRLDAGDEWHSLTDESVVLAQWHDEERGR